MLLSKLLGERFKEKPAEASINSHILLLRGGYIKQVANGIYSLLPPAKRVAKKIEAIIREEMDAVDGQEVMFPVVLPAELWEESGRYTSVGSELMRMKDRTGRNMVLGMTHEEASVHMARDIANSYLKYPFMIYQIQTKFRDEPRSRGGLIRVREFTMKDAYSFHTSQECLEEYYDVMLRAYHRICARVGLPGVVSVKSDTGMMGGKVAHEFMFLTDAGEDSLIICSNCDYKANMEVAVTKPIENDATVEANEISEVHTPDITDIEALSEFFELPASSFMKAAVFGMNGTDKPVVVFIRGDKQVNETKLTNHIRANIFPLADLTDTGLIAGFIGAYGLDFSKYNVIFDNSLKGGQSFIGGANKTDYHVRGLSMQRDFPKAVFADVAMAQDGDCCSICGGRLKLQRGIEIGNIFQLGTKYSESMKLTYADVDGKQRVPIMGCYGIGVGRLLASVVEERCDENGPVWPISISPWQVHICMLTGKNEDDRNVALKLYSDLSKNYEVIADDRKVSAGIQFADADLLGVPIRVIVGSRNLKNGEVELSVRSGVEPAQTRLVKLGDISDAIGEAVAALQSESDKRNAYKIM